METCRKYPALTLLFYIFLLGFSSTCANRGILLQEPNNNWKNWVPGFLGTSWSSAIYFGEPIYASCSVGSSREGWLLSPFIPIPSSVRTLTVKFNYTVQKCASFNYPPSTCREALELLKREENISVRISELRRRRFDVLTTFMPSPGEFATIPPVLPGPKSTFLGSITTQADGVYVAIKNVGVCMALFSFEIFYRACLSQGVSLVRLSATVSPDIGSPDIEVNGSCVDHAVPAPGSSRLYALCHSNGEWIAGVNSSCGCTAGYQENTALNICEECPNGTFKAGVGNELCRNCPAKSVPNINRTGCECIKNYFRLHGEPNCTGLGKPSAPENLRAISLSDKRVTLVWQEPTDTGGRGGVDYEVYCMVFAKVEWKICSSTVGYEPKNDSLVQKKVTLSNLRPHTKYKITVASRNGASNLLLDTNPARSTVVIMTYKSGMLLQEPNNNWKRWVPEFRGTSWSSLIYLGEPVFASCSVGSSNEEWLLSPFIQIPSSVRSLNVKFNYTVQNCSSFNKPPSTCHETIQLLKREESKPVRISELRRRRFDILTNFTPSDGELVTTPPVSAGPKSTFISTIKTQARGAYLAIKNVGVCVALFSFELSHGTCSPRVVNLVKLNTTAAPAIGSQGIEVNGSCVDHAVPAPSSLRLYALCHSNGEWTAGVNVSCVCTAGYQENTAKNICEAKKITCKRTKDGTYPHPRKCSKYIVCSHWVLYIRDCPKPLFFNPKIGVCDWMRNVDCSQRGGYNWP